MALKYEALLSPIRIRKQILNHDQRMKAKSKLK